MSSLRTSGAGTRMARSRRKSVSPVDQPKPTAVAEHRPTRRRTASWLMAFAVVALALAGAIWLLAQQQAPRNYGYRVMNTFPHDPTAYTQGLVFRDGFLFEGTGKHGQSSLRRVELESGRVVQSHSLARELFGEGITIFGDRIYQLTWRNGIAIVYDKESFRELKRLRYEGEGWGLTDDGTHLIMSDGSATLRFVDPEDFQVVRRLLVHSQGRRVDQLNELEYINGEIFANIWYRDHIARISPKTGEVTGWIDLRGLWPKRRDRDDVLNGIAYDAENDRLFVTGKNWPRLYEIQLAPR
jgi:glutaminyl-peptide cyclotransferase